MARGRGRGGRKEEGEQVRRKEKVLKPRRWIVGEFKVIRKTLLEVCGTCSITL